MKDTSNSVPVSPSSKSAASLYFRFYQTLRHVYSQRTTKDILLDVQLGLAAAFAVALVQTHVFHNIDNLDLTYELLSFFVMSWATAVYTRLQTPVLDEWRLKINELQGRDPPLRSFLLTRINRRLGELFVELEQLHAGWGEPWSPKTRLDTANDLFDGFATVHSYDATAIDPPYWPIAGINTFYARQAAAGKFPGGGSTTGLLIYPEDALLHGLDNQDCLNNFERFIPSTNSTASPCATYLIRKNTFIR